MSSPDMGRASREARSPEADLPQDHPITAHNSTEWLINGDLAEIVVLLSQCAILRADQAPGQTDARALVAIESGLGAVAAHPDHPHSHEYVHVLIAALGREINRSVAA
jgi:hypothetical protein